MGKTFALTCLLAVAASTSPIGAVHAGAAARGFVCGVSNGAPSTNAVKADGRGDHGSDL